MEVKIGVANARELSIETSEAPDEVLGKLSSAIKDEAVFALTDDKDRTVAIPADKVTYLYFTADTGRKVGFGAVTAEN